MGNSLISVGDLKREEYKDEIILTKHIVYFCNCSCIDHHSRILFYRELSKKGYVALDDITWEFNITHLVGPRICYTTPSHVLEFFSVAIKKLFARVVAAKNILLGKPVHFNSDICINTKEMREIMDAVGVCTKELDEAQEKIAQELKLKKESTNV